MDTPKYMTTDEIEEYIHRVGDVILDIDLHKKGYVLPERMQTAYLMLKTAHSMLADFIPSFTPSTDKLEDSNNVTN